MRTLLKNSLAFLLALMPVLAFAQQAPLIMNVGARQTTSLDGQWKTIVDPFENGYYDYRLKPYDGGYAQDKTYSDKTQLQEYDFETDKLLFVPGDWNTQRPQLYYYEGTVWYRKHFEYSLQPGKRLFVNFGAANYEAIVWLNGKRLGQHVGGFTPFNYEITNLLKDGTNSLVVKVDNKRRPEAVPTVNADWWNFGGITRPVTLVEMPSTYIRDYYVQLQKNDKNMIEGWVQLDGSAKEQKVVLDIPELKINKAYLNILEQYQKDQSPKNKKDVVSFVKYKLNSARSFIDAVQQRNNTLMLTMTAIVQFQKQFFLTGDETMLKPMILKDIADITGLDVSTISRVSNSKYVQTWFGIYALKDFFTGSMQTTSGEEVSTGELKNMLKKLVDDEDKKKPLTDDELVILMEKAGYQIARRTVAKYRQMLDIPVARLRREI